MCGDFHMPLLRFLAWFFRKIYRMMYDNVLVDERGIYNISNIMKNVSGKKIPVILLPTQRSYLDFMIMTYIMFCKTISFFIFIITI
jgi:glycerone phosphate O-acyltransferase